MLPEAFMLEEYKALYTEIANSQKHYSALEALSFGGTIAAYGFMLSHRDVPAIAWAMVPLVLATAGVRCFAYYWLINKRIAPHLERIEKEFYASKMVGYQRTHTEAVLGRNINIAFNTSIWLAAVLGSTFAFFWRLSQPEYVTYFVNWPWIWKIF